MKLSKRLKTIHDLLPNVSGVAADVGSDHGKLIISLFLNKKIKKGYAIENKLGPFNRLVQELTANNIKNNEIEALLSDGISELPDDVNQVIVAGMGGSLIVNILKKDVSRLENVEWIIVDPHNAVSDVRKEITNLGYSIYDEEIIFEDNIYYEIILFKKGKSKELNDKELKFGPVLLNKKTDAFISKYKDDMKKIRDMIDNPNIPSERKETLKHEIKMIEEIL